MKILVLVKEVPDTASARRLHPDNGLLDRAASPTVPDEINERAIEHALQFRENGGDAEIVALSLAPEGADATLRKFLAMGADSGILVSDGSVVGADAVRTSQILAHAVKRLAPDLVITGGESTDGRTGVVPAMIAELLGWPLLPGLDEVEISAEAVVGRLSVDGERVELRAELPAVAATTERSAEPRFPNFKGIMQAKKKPLETWALADLGVGALHAAASVMVSAVERPAREAGTRIVDDGDAAEALADFLATNRLI